MAQIKFSNVSKTFMDGGVALEHASFEIGQGEFLFLIGRSGAGKSTVLKLMTGQIKPSEGDILMNGITVNALERSRLPYFRRQFGIMDQELGLVGSMNVKENIMFVLHATGYSGGRARELAKQALQATGIYHKRHARPAEMSGGERARAMLARAIAAGPSVVIADEPTANLDPDSSWDIMCLLDELNQRGITIIVASHDREMVSVMKKRVITLSAGKLVADERRAVYNTLAADFLEERRVLNERKKRKIH